MTIRSKAAKLAAIVILGVTGILSSTAAVVTAPDASASPRYSNSGADNPEQACRQERPSWDNWDYTNVWFGNDEWGHPSCYGARPSYYDHHRREFVEVVEAFPYPHWRFPLHWR